MHGRQARQGFTLTELSVAAAFMLVALSLGIAGLTYAYRGAAQNRVQNELDIDVQTSMERLKKDLRLSSLDKMVFWPEGSGPHTAIGFPRSYDTDQDGALERDEDGWIQWDETRIYHVWPIEPHQLRLTIFNPRQESLSDTQRQEQINKVVQYGHGGNTHNGENASTEVVFENLFQWEVTPRGSTYDCFASTLRHQPVNLGSCVLSPGNHTFQFAVAAGHGNGFKLGLDTLYVSPSYSPREAEAQWPPTAQVGVAAQRQYMPGGSWSGNYQLYFPATEPGQSFTLTLENDRWEQTNFDGIGDRFHDTRVYFDETCDPYDFVVALKGMDTNWWAVTQTSCTNDGAGMPDGSMRGACIRVPIRGEDVPEGGWIEHDGRRCRVNFKAGLGKMRIEQAYIAEAASSVSNTMDCLSGTKTALTFGGAGSVDIDEQQEAWSDYAAFAIDREKTYLVTFLLADDAAKCSPWWWRQSAATSNAPGCYVVQKTNIVADTTIPDSEVWSGYGFVNETNGVFGVQKLFATYPEEGFYTSPIFDTQQDTPAYQDVGWNAEVPSGAAGWVKIRTGSSNDLSDASAWSNVMAITSQGPMSPGPGDYRYVQFQVGCFSSSDGLKTPKFKDLTIRWTGVERAVDVGAVVTKGPDYGVLKLLVDGKELITGINIDLEIFKQSRGYAGDRQVTSALTAEVEPRNSGR